jgi:hypothetical protein
MRTYGDPEFTDEELQRQHTEHRASSKARLQISADSVTKMVAEFVASHRITRCQPAYAAALSPQYRCGRRRARSRCVELWRYVNQSTALIWSGWSYDRASQPLWRRGGVKEVK